MACKRLLIFCGLFLSLICSVRAASDLDVIISTEPGKATTAVNKVPRDVVKLTQSGVGPGSLGNNCPAIDCSQPYAWHKIQICDSAGQNCFAAYMPLWK